jgi:hypothetical protein
MFQTGAVEFLVKNNFDFNKLFSQGINFGRFSEIKEIQKQCENKI